MANMRDKMAALISNSLRERLGEKKFIQLTYNAPSAITNSDFHSLQQTMKENKAKVQITDIKPISTDLVNFIEVGRPLRWSAVELLTGTQPASTGVYEVTFSSGDVMMTGAWLNYRGQLESITGGTTSAWNLLRYEIKKKAMQQEKPKHGVFLLESIVTEGKQIIKYKAMPWNFKVDPIHPKLKVLENEVTGFFGNISDFSQYGQVPFRKLITIGVPGTGKSSINFAIAKRFKENHCIVFTQDINAIYMHMSLCAKHGVSTIIFFDDAEDILSSGNSALLNFFSGSKTPNTKKGTMLIFTSNMTNYIEPRVLRRPGRIDRIVEIDPLRDQDLLKCAKMYFKHLKWKEKTDKEWIELFEGKLDPKEKTTPGMTGAEVQGLAQYVLQEANSQQCIINYDLIKQVKEQMASEMDNAYSMIHKNSMVKRKMDQPATSKEVGFKY